MTIELRNVAGRPESPFFSQVAIADGGRAVHLAGQTGTDEQGRVVDGGLAAQAERALLNVGLALDGAGASEADLAKITVYVVGWEPSMFEELGRGLLAAQEARPFTNVPVTLIGVQSLFEPEMLIEIEGVAYVS